jgi:hypothetical protein
LPSISAVSASIRGKWRPRKSFYCCALTGESPTSIFEFRFSNFDSRVSTVSRALENEQTARAEAA